MKTTNGISVLAVLLFLLLTNVAAADEHLATVMDVLGNKLELRSDTKSNCYILKSHSFYGGDNQTFTFTPEEMKEFRVAYKEARARFAQVKPGFKGTLASKRLGRNGVFSFSTSKTGKAYQSPGMMLRWDDEDNHGFHIPVSWPPNHPFAKTMRQNKADWEALLEQTNY